jgi:hypothetical protein
MDFGIDFVNGVAKASVFMDMDMSGIVDLQLTAGPSTTAKNTSQATKYSSGSNATIPGGPNSRTKANNTYVQSPQPNSRSNTVIPDGPVPTIGKTSFNAINSSHPLNSSSSSNCYPNAAF